MTDTVWLTLHGTTHKVSEKRVKKNHTQQKGRRKNFVIADMLLLLYVYIISND
jgi:hypothetical protein